MTASERIKAALAQVHMSERTSENPGGLPRPHAVRDAIRDYKLDALDAGILLRATHVTSEEL